MHAHFQVIRKAEFLDGQRNGGQVVVELLFELHHVTDIVDALVESAVFIDKRRDVCIRSPFPRSRARGRTCSTPARYPRRRFSR